MCVLTSCIGISTRRVREELDQPVAPEVSTPTEDHPSTEKNNPAFGKFWQLIDKKIHAYVCTYVCAVGDIYKVYVLLLHNNLLYVAS